ncbi:MAG: hypothetical protein IH994_04005 [Proteobacteria bacterium]|nr:hypothetical protein [Pseudomonadota bacterium]
MTEIRNFEIRNFFVNLFIARQAAAAGAAPAPSASKGANKVGGTGEPALAERTVGDTVTLSEGGQKIVNLARGRELAEEIRTAPLDKDFVAKLLKAQEDIFRITRLFTETFKAAFLEGRRKG